MCLCFNRRSATSVRTRFLICCPVLSPPRSPQTVPEQNMQPLTKLFINGEYRPSSSSPPTFEVLNPFSHHVVGLCSTASSQDCRDAIEAAHNAFASWENTTPWQRRDILLKAADLIATEKYKQLLITSQREETAATDGWGYGQWVVAQPMAS